MASAVPRYARANNLHAYGRSCRDVSDCEQADLSRCGQKVPSALLGLLQATRTRCDIPGNRQQWHDHGIADAILEACEYIMLTCNSTRLRSSTSLSRRFSRWRRSCSKLQRTISWNLATIRSICSIFQRQVAWSQTCNLYCKQQADVCQSLLQTGSIPANQWTIISASFSHTQTMRYPSALNAITALNNAVNKAREQSTQQILNMMSDAVYDNYDAFGYQHASPVRMRQTCRFLEQQECLVFSF